MGMSTVEFFGHCAFRTNVGKNFHLNFDFCTKMLEEICIANLRFATVCRYNFHFRSAMPYSKERAVKFSSILPPSRRRRTST